MKGTFSRTSTNSGPSHLQPVDFQPLGRVIFAPGSLTRLGEAAREVGIARALLVTDPGLTQTAHPRRAVEYLEKAGVIVATFDGVKENPTEKEFATGVELARRHGVDGIVAIGGGSSMDCAKGINFLLTNGGKMADYKGHGKATKPMLPSIGVPTTSGTGSEAQCYALITDSSSHMKMACGDKKAAFRVSILDPELTLSQPRMVTAVTGIDALAHAVESLVCTKANPFSRMCSLAAWHRLEPNFETVLHEPQNLAARAEMQIGSHFAGRMCVGTESDRHASFVGQSKNRWSRINFFAIFAQAGGVQFHGHVMALCRLQKAGVKRRVILLRIKQNFLHKSACAIISKRPDSAAIVKRSK